MAAAYSLEEQFGWQELPAAAARSRPSERRCSEAADDEAAQLIAEAHAGSGGKSVAPASAGKPKINLYNRSRPAVATVTGNFRLTAPDADNDVRHIILDFGDTSFPVLEGQSIGIIPPGGDAVRQAASHPALFGRRAPRDGEKPKPTISRSPSSASRTGVCSNYVCDLKKGDKVQVTGPFGATFLMPDDPSANILMICTGTGSAPFRGFTERRRRAMRDAPGRMMLFFGARRPEELPYFGPLQKVPDDVAAQTLRLFAHSRASRRPMCRTACGRPRRRSRPSSTNDKTHIYLCGLKGMEGGVDQAFADICRELSSTGRPARRHARAGPLSRGDGPLTPPLPGPARNARRRDNPSPPARRPSCAARRPAPAPSRS